MNYTAIALTLAGMIGLWNAAEWESRDGSRHHGVLWAGASLLLSLLVLFVAGWGVLAWLLAQAGLFIAIAAVRVWLEDRHR